MGLPNIYDIAARRILESIYLEITVTETNRGVPLVRFLKSDIAE